MDHTCPNCGSPLVPEEAQATSETCGAYRVTVRGPGVLKCPRGCVQERAPVAIDVRQIFSLSRQIAACLPKMKGFFKKRPVCRQCGADLVQLGAECRWTFGPDPPQTGELEFTITGPGMKCTACERDYLPPGKDIQAISDAFSRAM